MIRLPSPPKISLRLKGFDIKRFFAIIVLLVAIASFSVSGIAKADVNDFTVTDFRADYYLSNTDPQGQLKVVEQISVAYTDQNHGILRALPESYKGLPLHLNVQSVSSDTGAPAQYTTSSSNGNDILQIGDPNRTVSGEQEYTIKYSERNVISFYNDHDELYWDVNGNGWSQPFTLVQATLHLPTGLKLSSQKPTCYTGSYGSNAQQCQISVAGSTIITSANNLSPGSTLTFVAGFQKGFFRPENWHNFLSDYGAQIAELTLPIILLGGGGFVWWWKRGRDAKGRGTIIPEYDAPDGLTPLEVGTVIDFAVENRDLTATIIDLAIRKYIRIIETDSTKMIVMKQKSYELLLLNKDWSSLNEWERQLMENIFGGASTQEKVTLTAMATKLNSIAKIIKRSVSDSLTQRGYFVSNPSKYITVPISLIVILVWFFVPTLSSALPGYLIVGVTIGLILLAVFYHLMPARTAKGVAAKEHILGLKMYLEVAEKNRIAKLQSPDAPYADTSTEPKHTVKLFEKLLPFAIVLKVEDKWAEKFNDIYSSPPDWYAGNFNTFNAIYLATSLNSGFSSSVNSTFSAPRSAGGSGFGGGGFAGGGGGGGGGGGW